MSCVSHRRESKSKNENVQKEDKYFQEDKYLKSYNQELKESMTSFKAFHPITQDSKLFYHLETNNNTSISSTTGQLEVRICL